MLHMLLLTAKTLEERMLLPDGLYRTYQPHRDSNKSHNYSSTPLAANDNTAGVLGLTAFMLGLGFGGVMLAAWQA